MRLSVGKERLTSALIATSYYTIALLWLRAHSAVRAHKADKLAGKGPESVSYG